MMILKMVTMMKMTMTMIAMILLLEMSHQTGRTFSRKAKGNRRQTDIKKRQSGTDRRKTEDTKPSNASATTRAQNAPSIETRDKRNVDKSFKDHKTIHQVNLFLYFSLSQRKKKTSTHNICHDVMLTLLRLKLCMYIAECQVC